MGLGRDATTYGFRKENRDDIVECGREVTWLVLLTAYRAVYQKLFCSIKLQGFRRKVPLTPFLGSAPDFTRAREKESALTFNMTSNFATLGNLPSSIKQPTPLISTTNSSTTKYIEFKDIAPFLQCR
jgi:hypothetical protein